MTVQSSKRALISVSDKKGLVPFAKQLTEMGFEIVSTGGTARALEEAGISVQRVSEVTGFPEILSGRVKTLHPKIHGGILGRPDVDADVLKSHDIQPFQVVAINLYPFAQTVANPDSTFDDAIENIDIGGPAMVRASAKNHAWITIVTNPDDYEACISELRAEGKTSDTFRQHLALKAFEHTASYDSQISDYLNTQFSPERFPQQLTMSWQQDSVCRYGENPHQKAAVYFSPGKAEGFAAATTHQGKALSFNNYADADAAIQCVAAFEQPACVIVKHANPCGVAIGNDSAEAYARAFECDPTSAFGGIIAFNREVDSALMVQILEKQFVEVIVAPSFEEAAIKAAERKPNVRVLSVPPLPKTQPVEVKIIAGGALVQTRDGICQAFKDAKVVTRRQPTDKERADAAFAWQVCQYVKSNAIVFAKTDQTVGIGAGQMSRIVSTRIALQKATDAGFSMEGVVMASDAFFPFPDSVEQAAEAGIKVIVQPGGSIRDEKVIAAADEHGIAMIFTGTRHFKH